MYQQVYHHKAVRAAEVLVRAILLRASELIRDGVDLPAVPPALLAAARGDAVEPSAYFELDDARLSYALSSFQHVRDPLLSDLARRFFARNLPKTLPLPDAPEGPELEALWQRCHERAAAVAMQHGFRPALYVWLDVPSDVPYAEPDVLDEAEHDRVLWVSLRHRPMTPLGDVSFLLRQLRNKRTVRPRLVFPGELREAIGAALEPLLASGGD